MYNLTIKILVHKEKFLLFLMKDQNQLSINQKEKNIYAVTLCIMATKILKRCYSNNEGDYITRIQDLLLMWNRLS